MDRMRAHVAVLLAALAACAPRALVRERGGRVVFAWAGEAEEVAVCGTMTGWRCVPLARRGRRFEIELPAPPGRHEFRLEVRTGGETRIVLPEEAERVEDGYGGENGVLRVGGG